MPLTPGVVIHNNRYRIAKLLGQGGMGAVYRGWDLSLGKACAIKENLDPSPEAARQFFREAQMLSNLTHPHLPRVTDYFSISNQGQYLVMDFVEGEDLETTRKRTGPLPEQQVLDWFSQVCEALVYLHSQKPPIIHRDIKPANIRITPQGSAMLVDFGIAKVFDPKLATTTGARAVTPGYSPPEQYLQGGTNPQSDIYALGATLYTLLTNQELPESINRIVSARAGNIQPQEVVPPDQVRKGIQAHLSQAIMKALAVDSHDRFASVADFKTAALAPSPTPVNVAAKPRQAAYQSPPPEAGQPPAVRRRRSPAITIAAVIGALLLIVACAAGGYFGWQYLTQETGFSFSSTNTPRPTPTRRPGSTTRTPTDLPGASALFTTPSPTTFTISTATLQETTRPTLPVFATPAGPVPTATTPGQPPADAVQVTMHPSSETALQVELRFADASPKTGSYVEVYKQNTDINGNPIQGERAASKNTDETGAVKFDLTPGMYTLGLRDLHGYPWGKPFNYEVKAGQTTLVRVTLGRLQVGVLNADGQAVKGKWIAVYLQKQDISGNPTWGDEVSRGYTDNTGAVLFDLTPGFYGVKISDLAGNPWGEDFNHVVSSGQLTPILVKLGRLTVGIKDADQNPVSGKSVSVYYQVKDVNGNPAQGDRFLYGHTDNTGLVAWDVTEGTYAVNISDLAGDLWGDPYNHAILSGQPTPIVVTLGRLKVGLKDNSGNPIQGRSVVVYHRKMDVNGNPTKGDRLANGYTDNTGLLAFDLTEGNYFVEIEGVGTFPSVTIQSGKTTVTDGISFSTP